MSALLYTIAFDPPGSTWQRSMAKLLILSLVRTGFEGDVIVFKNREEPIFRSLPARVEEVTVPAVGTDIKAVALAFKYRARHMIDSTYHDFIAFLDNDCLALQNINHWFQGCYDVLWQPEYANSVVTTFHNAYLSPSEMETLRARHGSNGGIWAVRARHYEATMAEWERIDQSCPFRTKRGGDQPAWNRVLLDSILTCRMQDPAQVAFASFPSCTWPACLQARLVHVPGWTPEQKYRFLFGLYMSRFFADSKCDVLEILEP